MKKLLNRQKSQDLASGRKRHHQRNLFWYLLTPVYLLWAVMTPGCSLLLTRGHPSGLRPPPAEVTSVAGYLSFRLVKDQRAVRGRAFFILVPGKGKIEVFDPLGRQIISGFWHGAEEWLIIPAERAYWYGQEASGELMATLLGVPLEPVELLGWIIGRSEGLELFSRGGGSLMPDERPDLTTTAVDEKRSTQKETNRFFPGWKIERDEKGRLWRGTKAALTITIEEWAPKEQVARLMALATPSASGRLTVLGLEFNRIIREDSFHPEFIEKRGFRAISREELETWLKQYGLWSETGYLARPPGD